MTFFARPNLEDLQFRQLSGSTLTLEGTTKIASPTGLQLFSGSTGTIAVAADSNMPITHGLVLAYDSTVNRIRLMDVSGGTGTNIYLGASPTTVAVGGMPVETPISGCSFQDILQCILVPAVPSAIIPPSASMSMITPSPLAGLYEVGNTFTYCVETCFCAGTVTPVYDENGVCISASGPRAGDAFCYQYTGIISTGFTSSSSSNVLTFQHIVGIGANNLTATVCHESGNTVYNSSGDVQVSGLSEGTVSALRTFTGIFPWFWGNSVTAPTPNQALIDSYVCKCVGSSAGNLVVPNYNVTGEYIWFAAPVLQGSTPVPPKTFWQAGNNISNNGFIPGDLFPAPTTVSIESPEGCWSPRDYRIYISNYPTSINYSMTFSN